MDTRSLQVIALLSAVSVATACAEDSRTPFASETSPSPALTATASGSAPVYRFTRNGDFADLATATGDVVVGVSVGRAGTDPGAPAWLFYFVERCARAPEGEWPSCELLQGGFGPVPTADLSGSGGGKLHLRTNTATNPDFYHFAGSGGTIDLEWVRSPEFAFRNSGGMSWRFGDFASYAGGTYWSSSAAVGGSVVGNPVGRVFWSGMGMVRGSEISFQRGR